MANNEFILLCTIFAHLFPLTDYSFFPPFSSVCEKSHFYMFIHTHYTSPAFFYIEQIQECLILSAVSC